MILNDDIQIHLFSELLWLAGSTGPYNNFNNRFNKKLENSYKKCKGKRGYAKYTCPGRIWYGVTMGGERGFSILF